MMKLITWCRQNIFTILTVFLLVFIPLYPKLPTVDIYGTWVSVRLEDFAVLVAVFILLSSVTLKKSRLKTSLNAPIVVYWIIGAISLIWSIVIIGPTLANYFPHLAIFHYLRRIEYMILFFVAYKAAAREKNLPVFIGALSISALGLVLYGLGQKFYGFPAYLTMNEEFAKGIPLRLPPTARIPSTFGGHYDLGAYLVLLIPIFASLMVGIRSFPLKIFFLFMSLSSLTLLLLTASRISFLVYLIAVSVMFVWHKKPLLIIPAIIVSFFMLNLVSTASDRFYKTFRYSDVIVDLSTGKPIGTLDKLEGSTAYVEYQENPAEEELPKGSEFINLPQSTGTTSAVRTIEVFRSFDLATGSGEIATISGSFLIQKALVYDISITTRFQGQWPKAVEAFKRNIVVGSGYSTLSVASDGDYLRMLGETGILGMVSFLGIFITAFVIFSRTQVTHSLSKSFIIGVFAGIVGLFFNALLIDVFEASKVAYSLWLLLGISLALLESRRQHRENYVSIIYQTLKHPLVIILYLIIAVGIVYGGVLSGYFVGDDFTWLRWAASSTTGDISEYFTKANGFFYRPIPKLWYFLLYSIFWLKAGSYHFITLVLYIITVLCIYKIVRLIGVKLWVSWLGAFLFGVLAIHHENVFWISGYSGLLAALFFFISVFLFLSGWRVRMKLQFIYIFLAALFLLVSMFSYEGLLLAPLVIWFISVTSGKQKFWSYSWVLICIPIYLYARQSSGAFTGGGDYAYNLQTLPANILANLSGYFISVFGGPKVIEYFQQLRSNFRMYKMLMFVPISIVFSFIIIFLIKIRKSFQLYVGPMGWFMASILSLAPFLGLGGLAERYALVASGFIIIGGSILLHHFVDSKVSRISKFLVVGIVVYVTIWNIFETRRISGDWSVAHNVSKQTLLTMKKEFYPIRNRTVFVFVDTPIRYGRAWIFPTGLTDAFWHLFRGTPYAVLAEPTLPEAFDHNVKGSLYVLTFENYVLKRVQKQIETVNY